MFEGTDLSLAFGGSSGGGGWGGMGGGGGMYETATPPGMMQTPSGPKSLPSPPPQAPMPELTIPQSTASHSTMGDSYDPPEQMYAQQSPTKKYKMPTNNFWDRMSSKRLEVAKLVVFALVILLAISLDRFVTHYLTQYFGQSFLTETQELLIRIAYPLIIILVIWLLKSM